LIATSAKLSVSTIELVILALEHKSGGFIVLSFFKKKEPELTRVRKKLNRRLIVKSQDDFKKFLQEIGMTENEVRSLSERTSDLIELPVWIPYKIRLGDSQIEGLGVFATSQIRSGEHIAPARVGRNRTICGRFINHSLEPNAKFIRANGIDLHTVASCLIAEGTEITLNYRQALEVNREFQISLQEGVTNGSK